MRASCPPPITPTTLVMGSLSARTVGQIQPVNPFSPMHYPERFAMTVTITSLWQRTWTNILSYVVKFGVVGIIGVGVDVAIFNALRLGVVGGDWWINGAIGAKVVSTSVAIVTNWLGNRYWTFRHDRHKHIFREFVEFVLASLIGLGVTLLCLWVSHYLLGLANLVADNISANIIGLALGTAARFVLYRFWVWSPVNAGATGVSIND